jgi:hypothetical protein
MKIPKLYSEAWGAYIALRRLGFPDKSIDIKGAEMTQFSSNPMEIPSSDFWVVATLEVGEQCFFVPVARFDPAVASQEESTERLKQCHDLRDALGAAGLEQCFYASRFGERGAIEELGRVLQAAGFMIPAWMN